MKRLLDEAFGFLLIAGMLAMMYGCGYRLINGTHAADALTIVGLIMWASGMIYGCIRTTEE